jgi:hypothetical protein
MTEKPATLKGHLIGYLLSRQTPVQLPPEVAERLNVPAKP